MKPLSTVYPAKVYWRSPERKYDSAALFGQVFGLAEARGFCFCRLASAGGFGFAYWPFICGTLVQQVAAAVLQDKPGKKCSARVLPKYSNSYWLKSRSLVLGCKARRRFFITLAVSDAQKMQQHLASQRILRALPKKI